MKSYFKNIKKIIKRIFTYFDVLYNIISKLFPAIILFLVFLSTLVGGAALGYFVSLVEEAPKIDQNELQTKIYDYNQKSSLFYADNSKISDLRSDLFRTQITLEEVSPVLINAIIATEDENFYNHKGIVPKAIIRAGGQELVNASSVSGGSTITQQLIKQQILSNEVTHSRKAIELLYAIDLENKFSKDEILQAYINVSPFGRNSFGQNIAGVLEAAQGIFGVNPRELSLPQAAFLAGLPKSPISYSPYTQTGELKENIQAGLSRQHDVLYSMFREGYIKEEDYKQAIDYDLREDFLVSPEGSNDSNRSYVYDLVEKEAQEIIMNKMLEKDEQTTEDLEKNPELKNKYEEKADIELKNGGYKIYSTIDSKVHNAIEEKIKQTQDSFGQTRTITISNDNSEEQNIEYPVQVGGSLIENGTGKVIAFVGGRDYETKEFNNAFEMRRGSGSSIKPLVTYGPALAENFITPATIIPDTELLVPDGGSGTHNITNFGRTTNKWEDARHWLAVSQNIPNTKLYMAMLKNNINPKKYVRKMGIGPEAIQDYEFGQASTSLGAYSEGPTPTELAAAYAAIGNKGVYNEPYIIEKIENKDAEIIYEHEANPTRVWSETTNYLLYDMLRDVAKVGTAKSINSYLNFNADLASKTGTTNDFMDVWYAGVTPSISYVSWMGYDNQTLHLSDYGGLTPSKRNLRNWANVMNTVYTVNPDLLGISKRMRPPEDGSIVKESVVAETGMRAGEIKLPNGNSFKLSRENKSEIFSKNNLPGASIYDFAIGASNSELAKFWSSQKPTRPNKKKEKQQKNEEKKSNKKEEKEQKKKEEEQKKKEEEQKKKEEEQKKKEEEQKKKEEEQKKKEEEQKENNKEESNN